MFDITADDIALLNDVKLRSLVARLCEAEMRSRGFSSSFVTWGGDQNSTDGGIDVRVALPAGSAIDGFVPRAATGFQVKAQDMPRAEILGEMLPGGTIRQSIQDLADQTGAYIIVSSRGSVSDSTLGSRRRAMKEAMRGTPNADALALDFYDRTRIESWVRSHHGLIPWTRQLVGRPIHGWQSYGAWAYAANPVTEEYLLDETLRIRSNKSRTEAGVSTLQGIEQIRDRLSQPRNVVRLVGLSGVGKTRLVQALFDDRVGNRSLDPSIAIYTNMPDSPDPNPIHIASNLVSAGTRSILVIDNCPPELHQRLSELCRRPESGVSVVSVEYDIRDDDPEGTDVFTIEPSSQELIAKLLRQRYPGVSQTDAKTIAEFSGGNARIAIALAATIGNNETIAGLTDEHLFQRLFLQRKAPDEDLYLAAQTCSLVYSFQGEEVPDKDNEELLRLSKIIGKSPEQLFRNIAELERRDLVQQRSVWRAVLPPAIANRLATVALQNFPYSLIEENLVSAPARMLKSFSRRLGYLHASKEAITIVQKWLAAGGMLEKLERLNELGQAMLKNIAPVVPEEVLAALERTLLKSHEQESVKACGEYFELLRSIAHVPALFDRCCELMVKIMLADDVSEQSHKTRIFASLFQLYLSGTHATIEQRLKAMERILTSRDEKCRAIGIFALSDALEAWNFQAGGSFDFGARPRDYGYWPRITEDVQHWFRKMFELVEALACSRSPVSAQVRTALAEKFRTLWHRSGLPIELANVCRAIRTACFWPEGWVAVRQTLDLDGSGLDPENLRSLTALESDLRPTDLIQKVHSAVFSSRIQGIDFDDYEGRGTEDIGVRMARTEALAQDLGKAVALQEDVFRELLPELISREGRLVSFGEGLAIGTTDAESVWGQLVTALTAIDGSKGRPEILYGFLHRLNIQNPTLVGTMLDNAVEHDTLSRFYPFLQCAVKIENQDVARLKYSLELGKTPVEMYKILSYGRATDPIPPHDLKELLFAFAARPSGFDIAVEVLYMWLHPHEKQEGIAQELIDAGCQLIDQLVFSKKNDREDYRLGVISKSCLIGAAGARVTKDVLGKLIVAVRKYETNAFYHDDLLEGLFSAQPVAALDGLFGDSEKELDEGIDVIQQAGSRKPPLAGVPEAVFVEWCDKRPKSRYPAMARVIPILKRNGNSEPPVWTAIALHFLEHAPEPGKVLKSFIGEFLPSNSNGWAGSVAATLESNAPLLDQLGTYPKLNADVAEMKQRLQEWIENEKQKETAFGVQRDERFE